MALITVLIMCHGCKTQLVSGKSHKHCKLPDLGLRTGTSVTHRFLFSFVKHQLSC